MTDQVVRYDNEAVGPFVVGTNITWPTGGIGECVKVVVDPTGSFGKVYYTRLAGGDGPQDGEVITQGGVTADADGNAKDLKYPVFASQDYAVAIGGATTWAGLALGATHSHFFDAQATNVVVGEILTYLGGAQAEVITILADAGAAGELAVRLISTIDAGLPADDETFTGDISGDGTVDGAFHARAYKPIDLHRFYADLNDDQFAGNNDFLSAVDPTPSGRDTDEIVRLLGTVTITDEIAQHMYGGSVSQLAGDTLYSGLDLNVTSPLSTTRPVVIQDDVLITDYWNNGYNGDSIKGNIRIMIKTRDEGVDIDGKRVKAKLLEFGEQYFEAGTTLGTSSTQIALVSAPDGNNNTAVGTVAGAPYNTVVVTEGFQTIDYNNGAGPQPFGVKYGFGSANSLEAFERSKYIQRRGTAETLFGRDAHLFTGINLNFAYDAESANFTEPEQLAWGTEIVYSNQAVSNFIIGEVVQFVGSGAIGRVLYDDDGGVAGTTIFAMDGTTIPLATDTMLGVTSGTTADVDTVVSNTNSGTAFLYALDDDGTTGNMYCQITRGTLPINEQEIYGTTSKENVTVNEAGVVPTRTINNVWIGVYTGTNYQTNFGIGVDAGDAIAGDAFPDLIGGVQNPPDNQDGVVGNLVADDYVMVGPWDGSTVDVNGDPEFTFDQMQLAVALVAATSTEVDVGTGNIPENTPQVGVLRVARDSDGQIEHLPYDSHNNDDVFQLVGVSPSAANIGNNLMGMGLDQIVTAGSHQYTAVFIATPTQHVIKVLRGGLSPIKPSIQTATFGAAGFSVNAARTPDE